MHTTISFPSDGFHSNWGLFSTKQAPHSAVLFLSSLSHWWYISPVSVAFVPLIDLKSTSWGLLAWHVWGLSLILSTHPHTHTCAYTHVWTLTYIYIEWGGEKTGRLTVNYFTKCLSHWVCLVITHGSGDAEHACLENHRGSALLTVQPIKWLSVTPDAAYLIGKVPVWHLPY